MKKILWVLGLLMNSLVYGQVQDDFSDGNFDTNPQWLGDTGAFYVMGLGLLHTKMSSKTDTCYLATASTIQWNTTWEFAVKLKFDPSSSNFARIYLVSDGPNLKQKTKAYFLQIGESGSSDSYDLYRQDGNSILKIIDAPAIPRIQADTLVAKFKIKRDADGRWTIFAASDTASLFRNLGTVADTLNYNARYFGIMARYTASRSALFEFDDIKIYPTSIDTIPPKILSYQIINANTIQLNFDEMLDSASIQDFSNFELDSNFSADAVTFLNPKSLRIFFNQAISYGKHFLIYKNIRDRSGNILQVNFNRINFEWKTILAENFHDLVINELLPDPSPSVGLPSAEFIEIFNAQNYTIQLEGHSISDGTNTFTFKKDSIAPSSYLILCNAIDSLLYQPYGKKIACNPWPSLNNSSDHLELKNPNGKIIDSLSYNLNWYKNSSKNAGGYSLAMIDPYSICKTAGNWLAATETNGGSPGTKNSISQFYSDTLAIAITQFELINKNQIKVKFNHKIAAHTFNAIQFYVSDSNQHLIFPIAYLFDWTYLDDLTLTFDEEMENQAYLFYAKNIIALDGRDYNIIYPFGKNTIPQKAILNITEFMADPSPAIGLPELEYIEIYNNSTTGLHNFNIWVGNHSSKKFSTIDTLAPFQYAILCEKTDTSAFKLFGKTIGISNFPNIGNSIDTLYLYDEKEKIIDQVSYQISQWPSNRREGGYSLERINNFYNCSNQKLWHSSFQMVGGSPGQANEIGLEQMPLFKIDEINATSQMLSLKLSEKIDTSNLTAISVQLSISDITIQYIHFEEHSLKLSIHWTNALPKEKPIAVRVSFIQNCMNERIDSAFNLFITDSIYDHQLIINEILFNTSDSIPEFIELYNRSADIINLKNWKLGIRNSKNEISSLKKIEPDYLLYPSSYVCISKNAANLQQKYNYKNTSDFINNTEMPTLANEQGTVVLLSPKQQLIDEVYYADQMHLSIINNSKDVSLERRSENWASMDANNWGSAAANYEFATPGYLNSNHVYLSENEQELQVSPKVFSPNADGQNDILQINYQFSYQNPIADIDIFNREGQLVCALFHNYTLGQKGNIIWDGISKSQFCPNGIYVLRFCLFDDKGLIKNYKIPFGIYNP